MKVNARQLIISLPSALLERGLTLTYAVSIAVLPDGHIVRATCECLMPHLTPNGSQRPQFSPEANFLVGSLNSSGESGFEHLYRCT